MLTFAITEHSKVDDDVIRSGGARYKVMRGMQDVSLTIKGRL